MLAPIRHLYAFLCQASNAPPCLLLLAALSCPPAQASRAVSCPSSFPHSRRAQWLRSAIAPLVFHQRISHASLSQESAAKPRILQSSLLITKPTSQGQDSPAQNARRTTSLRVQRGRTPDQQERRATAGARTSETSNNQSKQKATAQLQSNNSQQSAVKSSTSGPQQGVCGEALGPSPQRWRRSFAHACREQGSISRARPLTRVEVPCANRCG